jgi:hypothetical protein
MYFLAALSNTWFLTFIEKEKLTPYFQFILSCQEKNTQNPSQIRADGEYWNIHHIIPKHFFSQTPEQQAYCESSENVIWLLLEDHITAHELLYEQYKQAQDLGAVNLLRGNKTEARKIWRQLGAAASHKVQKDNKISFWNSENQKQNAARSLSRSDALETRSKGGVVGGRNRNKDRVIKVTDRYLFSFHNEPSLCIFNCETGGDVLKILNWVRPTKIQRVSPILKGEFVTGGRRSAYGWSCEKI